MFCPNCGSEMSDAAAFCANCGHAYGAEVDAPKQKVNKKIVIWLLPVAVLLVALFCLFANNGVNKSAESVAIAALESEYEVDIDKMMKVFPEFTIRELAAEYGLSPNATRKEVGNEIRKEYRYTTPADIEFLDATVTAEYDISKYTIFRELYDYMTDEDYDMITHVAKVEVRFRMDGDKESVTVTCIKMKNKWYLLRT